MHWARQPESTVFELGRLSIPYLRPVRAVQHPRGEVSASDSTCARRPAVPRVRPADRGSTTADRGRLHRSRLCPAPARLPRRRLRPGNQAVTCRRACNSDRRCAADRRHLKHQARACPLGRHPAPGQLDQCRAPSPASLMLRKPCELPAPEQRTGRGLRELGWIGTLFILDWLQSVETAEPPPRACRPEQKRRARNSLARRCSSTALG